MSAHLDDDAMALTSLPSREPERVAAYAHAASCPRCALALRQAEALLAHLDALPPESEPTPASSRRVERVVVADLSARVVPVAFVATALAAVWALLVVLAKHRDGASLARTEAVALLAVSVALVLFVRRLGWAAAVLAVAASAVTAGLSWRADFPLTKGGVECLLTELAAAAIPLFVVARLAWRRRTLELTMPLVVVAAAGALTAQAALVLTCPASGLGLHVLVFHVGGVLAAVGVTAAAAPFARG